jgi:hypothetical protein
LFSATIAVDSTPVGPDAVLALACGGDPTDGLEAGGPLWAAEEVWPTEHDAVAARTITRAINPRADVRDALLTTGWVCLVMGLIQSDCTGFEIEGIMGSHDSADSEDLRLHGCVGSGAVVAMGLTRPQQVGFTAVRDGSALRRT